MQEIWNNTDKAELSFPPVISNRSYKVHSHKGVVSRNVKLQTHQVPWHQFALLARGSVRL